MLPPPEARRPRVLIADDYPTIVGALTRLLSDHCDIVGAVSDFDALLEAASRLQPEIVLLDLNLPRGNSLLACQEITRTAQRSKVIVMTGGADATDRPHVLAAGACAFIDKYAMADELLSTIARVLAP
jgi:DNA-binding NarL/FixJ family response regulator